MTTAKEYRERLSDIAFGPAEKIGPDTEDLLDEIFDAGVNAAYRKMHRIMHELKDEAPPEDMVFDKDTVVAMYGSTMGELLFMRRGLPKERLPMPHEAPEKGKDGK